MHDGGLGFAVYCLLQDRQWSIAQSSKRQRNKLSIAYTLSIEGILFDIVVKSLTLVFAAAGGCRLCSVRLSLAAG